MPKVDIVVPCYNYGRFLKDCMASLLGQSLRDIRVLIIDDASTDDSAAVASALAASDSRISLICHAGNKGHIATYNEGIAWASSDYFLLLSADDLLAPGALQRAAEIMDANPDVVLTFGDCAVWSEPDPRPALPAVVSYRWESVDLLQAICASATNMVPTPTAIVRTRAQKQVGGYRPSLPHAGDMEMWLRIAAVGGVARIEATQAIYRKHGAAMSNSYFARILSDWRQRELAFQSFFAEYEGRLTNLAALKALARRALAEGLFHNGVRLVRRGRVREGLNLIGYAMKLDRRLRYLPPFWRILAPPGPAGRAWAKAALSEMMGRRAPPVGSWSAVSPVQGGERRRGQS